MKLDLVERKTNIALASFFVSLHALINLNLKIKNKYLNN